MKTAKFHFRYEFFLICLIATYTVFFSGLLILKYKALFAYAWEDLAIYNQMLWNIANGYGPYVSITKTLFYEHVSFILFLMAFFYKFVPHIYTLFFLETLVIASGAIPLYLLAKSIRDPLFGIFSALIYLLLPAVHYVNLIEFRPIILSISLLLWAFYFFYKNEFRLFAIFIILSLLCEENVAFSVFFLGIYALILRREARWVWFPLLLSLAWFFLSVSIVLPWLGYKKFLLYNYIDDYVDGILTLQISGSKDVVLYCLGHPLEMLQRIFSKPMRIYIARVVSWPFFFLPVFSPLLVLVGLPTYLQIMLQPQVLGDDCGHQISLIIPSLVIAGIFGFHKCLSFIDKQKLSFAKRGFICVVIFLIFLSNFAQTRFGRIYEERLIADGRYMHIHNILDPRFYRPDDDDREAFKMMKMIPADASVSASGDLLAPLSHRRFLFEFGYDGEKYLLSDSQEGKKEYLHTDFILFHKKSAYHGSGINEGDRIDGIFLIESLVKNRQYTLIASQGDFILLKKFR